MSQTNLKNLKILITRPRPQAQHLLRLLRDLAAEVYLFPTLEIAELTDKAFLRHSLQKLDSFTTAIFVSANAVEKVMAENFKFPTKLSVIAVGAATAKALEKYQIRAQVPEEEVFSSEGLLALPSLQAVQKQSIVIFSGEGGRPLLAEVLRQRGAKLTQVACYRRVQPQINAAPLLTDWRQQGLDIIISTSGEGLQNLFTLLGKGAEPWLCDQQLLVISERMAKLAWQLGFKRPVLVAKNASNTAIIEALKARRNTYGS